MSGIAGIVSEKLSDHLARIHLLHRWRALLRHRGPDDCGWQYFEGSHPVLLFHCYLSGVGVEKEQQPLTDERKTIWLLFNGYLCGYEAIRKNLERQGHRFGSDHDAEIIIHLYEESGMDAVDHLRGEFAFALYDTRIGRIFLVRDRFGVKPLYYAHIPGTQFSFASEIKAIFADESFPRKFDLDVIRNCTNTFSFATETLFAGVNQVAPGKYVSYDLASGKLYQYCYWKLPLGSAAARGTDADLTTGFRELFREAVNIRIPRKANFGAFLSGGLDSSSVVAMMCQGLTGKFPVFTTGFDHAGYNESMFAGQLAAEFGLPHHIVRVGQGTLKALFIRSVWHSEIPVLNTHGAAKMLLSKEAGRLCRVLFSGEGADELLWGYDLFQHLISAETANSKNTGGKMSLLHGTMAGKLSHYREVSGTFGAYPYPMMRYYYLKRISKWLQSASHRHSYGANDWDWKKVIFKYISPEEMKGLTSPELTQLFLLTCDFPAYILNYLGDRQEMSMSVESRTPFLDHKLAEFTCKLPGHIKSRNGQGKYILREAFKGSLPDSLINRPKQVFYAPAFKSIDLPGDPGYFKKYTEKAAFEEVGIFSFPAFQILTRFSRLLPANHQLLPVIESLLIFVLSLHILYDLYISRFAFWSGQFAGLAAVEDH